MSQDQDKSYDTYFVPEPVHIVISCLYINMLTVGHPLQKDREGEVSGKRLSTCNALVSIVV